jgi:hypothetical protein
VVRAGDTESIVNMTGHTIHIYDGGRKLMTVPAEGREFRLAMREFGDFSGGGVPITTFTYDIPELPPVEPGTWYVVSQVAALAMVVAGPPDHRAEGDAPGEDRGLPRAAAGRARRGGVALKFPAG